MEADQEIRAAALTAWSNVEYPGSLASVLYYAKNGKVRPLNETGAYYDLEIIVDYIAHGIPEASSG
jgi:hypothetical protein